MLPLSFVTNVCDSTHRTTDMNTRITQAVWKTQMCVLIGQVWVESTVQESMDEDQGRFDIQCFAVAKQKMALL